MKKKGMRWKKFENLENDILEILSVSKNHHKTTGEIQKDLRKKGVITSWNTVKDYLEGLWGKGKVIRTQFGISRPFIIWGKK